MNKIEICNWCQHKVKNDENKIEGLCTRVSWNTCGFATFLVSVGEPIPVFTSLLQWVTGLICLLSSLLANLHLICEISTFFTIFHLFFNIDVILFHIDFFHKVLTLPTKFQLETQNEKLNKNRSPVISFLFSHLSLGWWRLQPATPATRQLPKPRAGRSSCGASAEARPCPALTSRTSATRTTSSAASPRRRSRGASSQ